jgi:voltage-gated potassium channel
MVEKGINYNIKHFGDSLWWAFTTVTTVGYGDITPVTPEGKALGVFLMLVGTALFALHTSLFAEALLRQDYLPTKRVQLEERHIKQMIEHLDEKLDKIEKKVS